MLKKTLLLLSFCTVAVAVVFAQRPSDGARWISFTEIGVLTGNPDNEEATPFIFQSSLNYAFHKHLSAGLGIGFDFLTETHMPLTANLLYQLGGKRTVAPFIRLQGGYQVPLESKTFNTEVYPVYYDVSSFYPYYPTRTKLDARGGFMANPSIGLVVYTKAGMGISLAAGYRYQQLNYKGDKDYELHVEYNRLSLTLGIIF
jgi:hypothetical protein